ncbi:nitrogen fixation protein FixH [Ideonella sp. 4Y16]|uniref:Nitrogen fixation protein FixH n=1 Tax=Ideonella alba TaxID=2824118 RepID=A0A941BL99_9BURK|nr:nitrogen fixation protein FixH [Ideonella alba]MBQ0930979.1 nitrogen fixation protein FixH [Ideonella alba]MBQ0942357.1 nitrogen fixation protein FixH [Ideonella alba]
MSNTNPPAEGSPEPKLPWWRYRMLWLVIGGPLLVVVASVSTAYVAIKGQDPVLIKDETAESQRGKTEPDAQTPAMQARNHAATPEQR